MIAWMVVIIAGHGIEYHAIKEIDTVFEGRTDALEFFGQSRCCPRACSGRP
jgi:hypothetical protein